MRMLRRRECEYEVFRRIEETATKSLVNKILAMKTKKPTADVSDLEHQIDLLVYDLYGLTEEERQIIEASLISKS